MINAKPNCVVCGQLIPNPESNYMARGNFCPTCNNHAEHSITERKLKKKKKENLARARARRAAKLASRI